MKTIEGHLNGEGHKVGICVSRFNDFVTFKLLDGAEDGLVRNGVNGDDIEVAFVPGVFELPLVAKKMAESGKYDYVIALDAVIRGETPHFDYVASESAKGVASVTLNSGIPVINGILTTDTTDQALDRSGIKSGNKGWAAAISGIEMANLMEKF